MTLKLKLLSIFAVTAFAAAPLQLNAAGNDDLGISEDSFTQEIFINKKIGQNRRGPKLPAHKNVHCYYNDGVLYFHFESSEGMCHVTLFNQNGGIYYQTVFDSATDANLYVGDSGFYKIELTTDSNEYEGYLE